MRSSRIPLPIVTERLLARPFTLADDAAMLAVYGDPEVMRFIPGGPVHTIEAVRDILAGQAGMQETNGYSYWALAERSSGDVIGDVGYGHFALTGDVELGYTLARGVWGKGYATEAARACLDAGLAHLDVARIVAVVDVDNLASQRVAERIGMGRIETIEAHGRPHVLFAYER